MKKFMKIFKKNKYRKKCKKGYNQTYIKIQNKKEKNKIQKFNHKLNI